MAHKGSMSPTSSPTVVIYYLFDNSHLIDMRCYLVILICISLMINNVEHLSVCGGHLYVFLRKMSVQILWLLFNAIVCFFDMELCEFFKYFGDKPPIRCIIHSYLLPFTELTF